MTAPLRDHPDHWAERAACRRVDTELFFPSAGAPWDQARRAKGICAGCPVRIECLDSAMAYEGSVHAQLRYGIFGGLDPNQRGRLADRPARNRKAS